MDIKELLARYAYYYEFLQKLGEFPLSDAPTIEELQLTRGIIQAGYKEINEIKFKGNLIDYLCYISTLHVVITTKRFLAEDVNFGVACQYIITDMYRHSTMDVNNLLRLMVRNPKYLYDLFGDGSVKDKTINQKLSGFDALFEVWIHKFLTGETKLKQ